MMRFLVYSHRTWPWHRLFSAGTSVRGTVQRKLKPFTSVLSSGRLTAHKSFLVHIPSRRAVLDVYDTCQRFGTVENMYWSPKSEKDIIVVEMSTESEAEQLLNSCAFPASTDIISHLPVRSRYLQLPSHRTASSTNEDFSSRIPLVTVDTLTYADLNLRLLNADNVSEQMIMLHHSLRMTEMGSRIRHLCAIQIEEALSGTFPQARALPFGSSVNSFGRHDCDLDIVLQLSMNGMSETKQKSPFMFHTKTINYNSGSQLEQLELISRIIKKWLPGCQKVDPILTARVPIIKYTHAHAGVECDLSMTDMTGVYMSEILYLFGEIDKRVRPLVFAVRMWAKERHITRTVPGQHVTNFMLTLMVISYLQHHPVPVLPTLHMADNLQGPDFKHLRTLASEWRTDNHESLATLLQGFFQYYEQFNFGSTGLSLMSSMPIKNPMHSSLRRTQNLHIENPLNSKLNVSRNVDDAHIEKLKTELQLALWRLDESRKQDNETPWGLLHLMCNADARYLTNYHSLKVNVRDILSCEDASSSKTKLHKITSNVIPSTQRVTVLPTTKKANGKLQRRSNKRHLHWKFS